MKSKISFGQKRILILLSILLLLVESLVMFNYLKYKVSSQQNAAKAYGESVASSIKLTFSSCVDTAKFMNNMYLQYEDNYLENFDSISEWLIADNKLISSVYFAPEGVIGYAYPESVKESTIGFEMFNDPEQGEMAQMAKATRVATIAGPHNLVEGGTGFIIRNPLYRDNEFIGFSIVIVDGKEFENQILSQIDAEGAGYLFSLWKTDKHAVTDRYGQIFNTSDKDISKDIDIDIEVPNDIWHLSIEPEDGWFSIVKAIPTTLMAVIMAAALIVMLYLRFKRDAKKLFVFEHDELTGMYNRQAFNQHIDRILKGNIAKQYDVMVADVENFKQFNSIYGEKAGDELLVYLSKEFAAINPDAIFARIGGDQFACIFQSVFREESEGFISKIKQVIDLAPINKFSVNFGIYKNVDHRLDPNIITDRALLAAKSIKNNYDKFIENYEGAVSSNVAKKQKLENSFDEAIVKEEFKVWLQPKFDTVSEKLVGAEALVRWIKSDGTFISPGEFIPIFEEDGLICRLDEYIFTKVCQYMKQWRSKGIDLIPISVNLSRHSLYHQGVIEKYQSIVEEEGIDPKLVPIELTESAELHSIEIKELAEKLKSFGFRLHMDDFGAGYSSLASLNVLPFDVVKLDKSLIDFIGDAGGEEIIRHIIELAQFKNLKVVAEGVEQQEQIDFLRKVSCDYIQGYFYSAPKSYNDFIKYISKFYKENMVICRG